MSDTVDSWFRNPDKLTSWYGKFPIIFRVLYNTSPGGKPDLWTINPIFQFKSQITLDTPMCKLSVWWRLWFSPRPCRRALSLMPWLDTSKTLWICKACSPLPCNSYVGSCCATKSWRLRCTNALMLVWVKKFVVRHDWIYHLEAHKIIKMYSIYQLEAQKPIIMELENPWPVFFHQCRAAVPKANWAVVNHLPVDDFPFFPQRLEIGTGFLGGYRPSNQQQTHLKLGRAPKWN